MGSRHGKRTPLARRCAAVIAGVLTGTALVGLVAWALVALTAPAAGPSAAPVALDTARPLTQDGRIVSVTANSVTAIGPDGVARTFLVTPNTTAVTLHGGSSGAPISSFAVNDEVSIVGEVRNGTAVATAVAAHAVTNLAGPPMEFPAA